MGPVILARAGLRFAIKVHGSDLSYMVRPHPERFVPYALEGTDAAAGHSRRLLPHRQGALRDASRPDACASERDSGRPGVDVHRFRPREPAEARRNLEAARGAARLRGAGRRRGPGLLRAGWPGDRGRTQRLVRGRCRVSLRRQVGGQQGRRPPGRRLAADAPAERSSAGARSPRLLLIGFGAFETGLRRLVESARRPATSTRRSGGGGARAGLSRGPSRSPLPILSGFPRRSARGLRGGGARRPRGQSWSADGSPMTRSPR